MEKERELLESSLEHIESKQDIFKVLDQFFSHEQIQSMINNDIERVKWTEETITKTLAFKCVSVIACNYVRNAWKLPLPSVTTTNRWLASHSSKSKAQ